jgi:hypothetical protein
VAYIKVVSQLGLEGLRKTTISHESQYSGRDLSPKPSKYETGVIDNHWEFCSVK